MKLQIVTAAVIALGLTIAQASLYDFSTDPGVSGYSVSSEHNWELNATAQPGFGGGGYEPPGPSNGFSGGFFSEAASSPAFADSGASLIKTFGSGYMSSSSMYTPYVAGGSSPSVSYGVAGGFTLSGMTASSDESIVVLFKNGGTSSSLSSISLSLDGVASSATASHVELQHLAYGEGQGAVTYDAYQFDVSDEAYSSYAVSFTTAAHGAIQEIQLETTGSYAAIPEPTTIAFMGLVSGAGLLARRFGYGA
ncbi:MAG TPA: hypothetical protein DD620_01790 [Verrucomicrobia bacterium]|nr:hypothetical protein [Kiritimatiellaceae bacterium]HBO87469.1 hypothetical protein [Verrucomicrobiota bacterium]|tara:strand:+ start:2061 stop:2813 length:753 start_codon:yes stop_codon:yes gene_type:complete